MRKEWLQWRAEIREMAGSWSRHASRYGEYHVHVSYRAIFFRQVVVERQKIVGRHVARRCRCDTRMNSARNSTCADSERHSILRDGTRYEPNMPSRQAHERLRRRRRFNSYSDNTAIIGLMARR